MFQLSVKAIRFLLIGVLFLSGCTGRTARHRATATYLLDPSSEAQSLNRDQTNILSIAKELLGTKYRFGGTNPSTGFDCSGYVAYVYKKATGLSLPRQSRDQMEAGRPVSSSLRPGDMVYFKISNPNSWHTGIYMGKGEFIHAPRTPGRVNIQDMNLPYWKKRFFGARRFL